MDKIHIAGEHPPWNHPYPGLQKRCPSNDGGGTSLSGVSILRNCPKIADVFCMEEILCALGADTWWQEHDLYLDCTKADKTEISGIYTEK